MNSQYSHVEPWLILGSEHVRRHATELRPHTILSLSEDAGWPDIDGVVTEYRHFVLDDREDVFEDKIHAILNRTTKMLEDAQAAGHTVIVHCVAGISRSATVVLDFLMKRDKLDYDTALARLQKKRYQVAPNALFERLLRQREAERRERA
jgi:hypothetical protein